MNPPHIERLLDQVVKKLRTDRNVRAIYVGGSIAAGQVHQLSDIDIYTIVRRSTVYVRYTTTRTDIEIDSFRLRDLSKRFAGDPVLATNLLQLKMLYDPEHLLPKIEAAAKVFIRR